MEDAVQKIIATLQTKISGINFNNWIKPATFKIADKSLLVEVPNKFIRDWITENYLNLIKYELFKITGQEHQIRFEIVKRALESEVPLPPAPEQAKPSPATRKRVDNLNPKYSFNNFVVGPSNQFCHAASKAVANLPALAYNPLFIYGGVGLGKTHLISAIGLELQRGHPSLIFNNH